MNQEKYNVELYNKLKDDGLIIYEVIVGSQSYGTNTPSSDVDKKFVYILPEDYILGTQYIPQVEVNADYVGYEIKRFLELIASNNPTLLEMLNSPEECILHKDPVFDYILERKDEFITKVCKDSFGGYAKQQIQKAKGLNKKQNWEKEKVTRKDVLDFVYVIEGEKSILWKVWNEYRDYDEKFCGVTNVPNARDLYAVFYDHKAHYCFSELESEEDREHNKKLLKDKGETVGLGYKGIVKVGEGANVAESNQLRLSSIPKGETPICNISYNKDGYTAHCKDYREYQEWLENRNETRYVETKAHGQRIDGKNMMHCMRLIRMAQEIGAGKGIIVRRPDAQELLSIRRGEVDLKKLMEMADEAIKEMNVIFNNSDLPESVDKNLVHSLLVKIRKEFYGRSK